ncbi:MAG: DUF885 domain-containing protein [Luminiphilus sp.]|nr:DUF885 domain-containing protein [Luminiphilus sp.]
MKTSTLIQRGLSAGALALVLAACDNTPPPANAIEQLADEYLDGLMASDALMGTYYSIEGARHDRLPDNSLAGIAAWQVKEDAWLAELERIGTPAQIGSRDWVTHGLLKEQLEGATATRICRDELWGASTTTSWHTWLPFVFDIQPLESAELREQAIARLGAVPTYIDNEIANLREGLRLGYSAPRVTVEAVPGQVRSLIGPDSIFMGPAARSDDAAFAAAVKKVYDEQIAPALTRYADFIENEYLDQARETLAVSGNPNGEACYPALVRSFVTVAVPAEEIHAVGLKQVANIREEIQITLDEHFGGGGVSTFLRQVNEDPAFTFDTEAAVLKYSTDALDAVKAAMPNAFGVLPKADVLVKPYPEFAESGSGEYHSSSEDGTRPGIFYIAVTDPTGRSRSNQLATLHHETFPGHHLQGAIALELGDQQHPLARYLWNSGYGEGWALYSERLADELGLYPTPLDRIGLYSDQIARASRLVMDSGLHTMGWTRQQAVDYMMANSGWAPVDIQNEVDRYISWPAQAISYMLGMLEIRRLRTLAETKLGEDFDMRGFHDRVVGMGSITLPMLEESIEAWITEQQTSG